MIEMEPVTITAKILGSGSFGCVRLGEWRGKPCAVKILQEDQARNSKAKERFENERRILKRLKHPNIVGLYDACLPAERFALVLELLMTTLRKYLRLTYEDALPIPFYRKVDLSSDVASGIRYLHSLSPCVLHRDLSDTNVLVSRNHRAKICDFGMAREIERAPAPCELTPDPGASPYMPPEARGPKPRYCTGIDVFSCGVLMLEIKVQKAPDPLPEREMSRPSFTAKLLPRIVSEVSRRQNHLRLLLPDDPLKGIILQCLHDSQEKRPTAYSLCMELEKIKANAKYGKSYSLEEEYKDDDDVCDLKRQLSCSRAEARKLQIENEELAKECDYLRNELELHRASQLPLTTALQPHECYTYPSSDPASAMCSTRSLAFPMSSNQFPHSSSDCSMLASRPTRRNTMPAYFSVSQESNHSKFIFHKPIIPLSQESKQSLSQESTSQVKQSLSRGSSSPRLMVTQALSQDTCPTVHRQNAHHHHIHIYGSNHLLPSAAVMNMSQSDTGSPLPFSTSPYQKQSFLMPQQHSSDYWANSQESEWYLLARPVMLVGPLAEEVKETLLDKFPDKFCCCTPFTTAPIIHPGEEKLHHHILKDEMRRLSSEGLFALLSLSDGHHYGITFSDILQRMEEGVHCLLPESINLVHNLQKRNINPIVISIIPSSIQVFVNMSLHSQSHLDQKEAFQLLESAIETNQEFQGLLTDVVRGHSFGEIYQKIKTTINHSGSDDVYCSV